MSEKYYIVSEAELVRLFHAGPYEEKDAEAACRARPVPDWATKFAGPVSGQYEDNDHYSIHRKIERFKK